MRQAAMLRGVNVNGRKLVMSELCETCEGAGFTNVQTLLASGNLVLDAKLKGEKLEKKLEAVILEGLGLKTDVYVRNGEELAAIIAANPYKAFAKSNPSNYVVYFMRAPASAAECDAMAKSAFTDEEFKQGENCLYVKFPQSQRDSKYKLPKLGTARNWNTVTKLAAMTAPA